LITNINKVPSVSLYKSHYFCDYIELIALINNNDVVSTSDIYDRFYDDEKIKIKNNESDVNLGDETSEVIDNWETKIKEWFLILEEREKLFSDFYPFIITNETTIILKAELSDNHKLYIFLLLNSNQKYISSNKSILTSDFEEFSLIALKNYLPVNALSYRFGKSMLNYDRYTGKLINKINLLASDLKYNIKYDEDDFDESDSGDGGLDLVSWIPFSMDEHQNNIQIILSQCATGKEWYKKQYETSKFTSNFIDFKTKVNNAIFIPYDGRRINRKFTEQKEILEDILLFDRIRILNLLQNNPRNIMSLDSFQMVIDQVIQYEEDIV
jgi:hypothetical protein